MKIFTIELKITLLVLVIVAAIIATGYLSYKNLSQIVHSIHREARPDYKLIKIKEITSDLSEVDNSVQLYSLTREPKYLKPYNRIISTVDKRIDELVSLQGKDTSQLGNIRAIQTLIGEKLVVWDQILRLHSKPLEKEVFNEFYTVIEKKTTDTINPKKDNILKRFFKRKKEITLGKEEVQQEVAKLERSLNTIAVEQAETESQLLKKNNLLGSQLQFLILQLEQKETENLFVKSLEAEILAQDTYRWLAFFCLAAVVLLIVMLFIIINYSRKSSQSQQVLSQAKNEAERLIKAKELFTANVSHELRTPMNAIYGLSEQLLQQPLNDNVKNQLTVIKKSAGYLNRIVNDILDFSKIEAGKLQIESIGFSPMKVLEEVCSLNQVIADQKNLDFKCNFSNEIPAHLIGDPTRLRQIILNLLNNAFKFTERGFVSIEAHASPNGNASVLLSVTISDSGIGIAPDKLNAIFDDYTQAEESINRKFGGTGLGLSIVKHLVNIMHGSIEVKSELNAGTSFTCSIPFEISTEIDIPDETDFVINPSEIQNLSVLVADDEEYNRMLLTTIFKKWNVRHQCVSNGIEAVLVANSSPFDVVLMDLRMPELNGYEAAKEILANLPGTKIIALTAGNYTDDINKCKDVGMSGYLLKPISEKELYTAILQVSELNTVPMVINNDAETAFDTDDIQMDELYRVSGGDERFVDEMLNLFIKTSHEGVKALESSVMDSNWSFLSDAAHKMAPPCKHLGAINLYRNLKELEKIGNNSRDLTLAKQIVEKVKSQVDQISLKIEQKIASTGLTI
jgi:signal transduction histidine kinase/CheY-like chemotaxis protein/HPt (histidine-containing phosphotransfer) domain-containing protein